MSTHDRLMKFATGETDKEFFARLRSNREFFDRGIPPTRRLPLRSPEQITAEAARAMARSTLKLKPGETITLTRNPDDAIAMFTVSYGKPE